MAGQAAEWLGMRAVEVALPRLYPKQRMAFYGPERYSLTEATVKSGKTFGALSWLADQALDLTAPDGLSRSGRSYWWIAPILPQAKIAYRRLRRGLARGFAPGSFTSNDTDSYITLGNGATVWFKGSDNPDSLFGEDVWAAVIDEASRVKEEAWQAVRSTLTYTKGPIRIIGNVKGRRNWFYQMARVAEAGEPGMAYHRIIAADAVAAGVLAAAEVEDARRRLPDSVFRELYLAEPSEEGGNPFGLDRIAACVAPLSQEAPMVWGWDLAKSQDFTVGIALDRRGCGCRFHRFQMPWPETRERIKVESHRPALLDSTGVGDPVLEELQRDGSGWFEGFKFTRQSKQELMTGLRNAVHAGSVHFPEGPIRLEMESFEYEVTATQTFYSAPRGMHDDCVMALALAWKHYVDKRVSGVPVAAVYRPPLWSLEEGPRRSPRLARRW